MTNCSRASSRSRWCAPTRGGRPGALMPATGGCARACSRPCPMRSPHSQQKAVDDIVADLASPERMLRLLQGDVGSGKTVVALLGRRRRDRGRTAGRASWRRPKSSRASISRPSRRWRKPPAFASAILTGRERGRERADILDRARARRHRPSGRHPCAVPGRRRLPRSRARRRRRAASLRRASAAGAGAEGPGGRRAGADRDADPAHAGAHLFRRHGHFGAAREAGRPPADRHPHHPARPSGRRGRRHRPRARRGPARLLGLPAGGGIREERSRRRAERATTNCARNSATRRSRPRPDERRRQGRRHGALRRRRDASSWSPPR